MAQYTLDNTVVDFTVPTTGDMFVRLLEQGTDLVLFEAKNGALSKLVEAGELSIITSRIHQSALDYFIKQQSTEARNKTKMRASV